ncbi:hypothetical protein KKF91_00390 [Myxococcota bacterium]|nr:hypothetical protein [Myxococcota bacterium]MBU1428993.1 hypothetical protein [Myxococcota bacterium]MBU1900159.1 hypothetical protein [Myxococcota bacterium]
MSAYRRCAPYYAALSLSLLALGCGEDDVDAVPADASLTLDARQVQLGDVGPALDADPNAPDANPDAPDPSCVDHWVKEISGVIQSEDGEGIADALAQMCIRLSPGGRLECLQPSRAQADGRFTILIPAGKECMESASLRIIKTNSGYATSYCAVDLSQARLEMSAPLILFSVEPATDRPPEANPQEARAVTLPGQMTIEVTPGEMFVSGSAGYEQMAGAPLRPDHEGICAQIDRPELDGIYLIVPEADVTGEGFPFQLPVMAPEGATAALYTLGGLDCHLSDGETVPEATWMRFGEGTIRDNKLTADAANGLPCLGWLGYKINRE